MELLFEEETDIEKYCRYYNQFLCVTSNEQLGKIQSYDSLFSSQTFRVLLIASRKY